MTSKNRLESHRTHAYPGPYKKGTCRWCGKVVTPPKRSWCGDENCVHEWRLRSDAGYARWQVEKRDKGVCSRCDLDTKKLTKAVRLFRKEASDVLRFRYKAGGIVLAGRKVNGYDPLWQAHHTVAVAEGGGGCGLDGFETLCIWCHGDETKALVQRLPGKSEGTKETKQQLLPVGDGSNDQPF